MRTFILPSAAVVALMVTFGCDEPKTVDGISENDGTEGQTSDGDPGITGVDPSTGTAPDTSPQYNADTETGTGIESGTGTESPYAGNAGGNPAGSRPNSNNPPPTEVNLSTVIALAQTLVTGTCMTFSAEYRVIGLPNPNARYLWVIEPSKGGQAVAYEVDMRNRKGPLQGVAQSLRPENGPYNCHIIEETASGERKKVSRSYQMPGLGGI
jgi:hypothetical protein